MLVESQGPPAVCVAVPFGSASAAPCVRFQQAVGATHDSPGMRKEGLPLAPTLVLRQDEH